MLEDHFISLYSLDNVKLVHKTKTTIPTECISSGFLAEMVALLSADERKELDRKLAPFVRTTDHIKGLMDRPIEVCYPKTDRHCSLLISFQICVDTLTSRIWMDCYEHDCADTKNHEKLR